MSYPDLSLEPNEEPELEDPGKNFENPPLLYPLPGFVGYNGLIPGVKLGVLGLSINFYFAKRFNLKFLKLKKFLTKYRINQSRTWLRLWIKSRCR